MATRSLPTLLKLTIAVLGAFVLLLTVLPNVRAQGTDCDDLSYSEAVASDCDVTERPGPEDSDDDTDGGDGGDAEDGELADRGTRGLRVPYEGDVGVDVAALDDDAGDGQDDGAAEDGSDGDGDSGADEADDDSDGGTESADGTEGVEADGEPDAGADADADADGENEDATSVLLEPTASKSNWPWVAGLGALLLAGGAFAFARKREQSSAIDRDIATPAATYPQPAQPMQQGQPVQQAQPVRPPEQGLAPLPVTEQPAVPPVVDYVPTELVSRSSRSTLTCRARQPRSPSPIRTFWS